MTAQDWFEQLGFLLVALFTLGSALGVILARRVLHAALWLLPTLFGVAGIFALMGAHALFAMQLIVYVGAIAVLIVFGAMLLEDDARERLPRFLRYRVPIKYEPATRLVMHYYSGMQHVLAGIVGAGMMLAVIIAALAETAWFHQWRPLVTEGPSDYLGDNIGRIGELFLTRYLLPFELASIVLLVALVGAVILARRDADDGTHAFSTSADEPPGEPEAAEEAATQ